MGSTSSMWDVLLNPCQEQASTLLATVMVPKESISQPFSMCAVPTSTTSSPDVPTSTTSAQYYSPVPTSTTSSPHSSDDANPCEALTQPAKCPAAVKGINTGLDCVYNPACMSPGGPVGCWGATGCQYYSP